jgi:hypothetical protein
MQAVACIFGEVCDDFKLHLEPAPAHPPQRTRTARPRRRRRMMAPVIIVGAMLVLVVWDTTDV